MLRVAGMKLGFLHEISRSPFLERVHQRKRPIFALSARIWLLLSCVFPVGGQNILTRIVFIIVFTILFLLFRKSYSISDFSSASGSIISDGNVGDIVAILLLRWCKGLDFVLLFLQTQNKVGRLKTHFSSSSCSSEATFSSASVDAPRLLTSQIIQRGYPGLTCVITTGRARHHHHHHHHHPSFLLSQRACVFFLRPLCVKM